MGSLATGLAIEGTHAVHVHVVRWGARLEAYLLLLRDEYPPFALE